MSEEQTATPPQAASRGHARRRQRPARLPLPAAAGQAADLDRDAVFVLAAGIAGAVFLGAAIGAGAAVAALLLSLLIVFAIADRRSEAAFFAAYASQRGMALSGRGPLPPATPLLRRGDDRYAEHSLRRPARRGRRRRPRPLHLRGSESTDSKGNRQTNYYRYTIGLVEVPECAAHVPELYCHRKSGLRSLEKLEDAFRKSRQRVEAGERGARRALRDLRRQGAGPGLAAPALLPHLRRLARRGSAEEVRLRAGRRHPLLLRQRPQEVGRRARHDPRRHGRGGPPPARGGAETAAPRRRSASGAL